MRVVTIVCLTLLLGLTGSLVSAETFYVNNTGGSDLNNGLSESNQGHRVGPTRSISGALSRTQRGDRIVVANTGVDYVECITLQGRKNSGYSSMPFVIEGNGATLKGIAPIPAHRWEVVKADIYRYEPPRGGYQSIFINGELAEQMPRCDGSSVTTNLKPNQWCRSNGGIHFATEKGKLPSVYALSYAKHPVGITLYNVEHVVIRDLNVRGFRLDGINAHGNARDCVLAKITSTGNGRSGISIGGASTVSVLNSEVRDNGEVELRADGWSTTRVLETRLVSTDGLEWTRTTNAFGNGARLFVDDELQSDVASPLPNSPLLGVAKDSVQVASQEDPGNDANAGFETVGQQPKAPDATDINPPTIPEEDGVNDPARRNAEQLPAPEGHPFGDPFGEVIDAI